MSRPPLLVAVLLAAHANWTAVQATQIISQEDASAGSFLHRSLPLNILSFLQWNVHNECFLSCAETKLPGHCDTSYPSCKTNATAQLRDMLHEGNGALDFAGIEQLANQDFIKKGAGPAWGQIYFTCGGVDGFGAMPFDIATLLFRKSRWEVKEVNGIQQKPFSGCMERNGQVPSDSPNNYRAFVGQAFVHRETGFEVVVVVAHFPHLNKYSKEIHQLSEALTRFRKETGIDKVVLLADTNREKRAEEIMADIYPGVSGVTGSKMSRTCCYPMYLHGFDRVIAGGFPMPGAYMKTIFPFGAEDKHTPPGWAVMNMHDPVIVEFSVEAGFTEPSQESAKSGAAGWCLWPVVILLSLRLAQGLRV